MLCYKSDRQITKIKKKHTAGTQDFNVKNPIQQREVKTTVASQQNFTISGVFTNIVGNHNDAINPSRLLTRNIYRQR
jgi:hypothetical protein